MKKLIIILLTAILCSQAFAQEEQTFAQTEEPPRSEVPKDHLAWFDLRGPVREVIEYGYYNYTKTVWRFDKKGRLTEYEKYGSPFVGDGGCVFRLMAHYRYAYDRKGRIMFLETYDEDYALVDAYADLILELFPPAEQKDTMYRVAQKEFGGKTSCYSRTYEKDKLQYYIGHRYDSYGNWIEWLLVEDYDEAKANVAVREIHYYGKKQ